MRVVNADQRLLSRAMRDGPATLGWALGSPRYDVVCPANPRFLTHSAIRLDMMQ